VSDNGYVPSYVVVRQAALKLGLDVLSGKPPRGRVGLFTLGHLAFSPSSSAWFLKVVNRREHFSGRAGFGPG
jgi:hypothetical protein